MGMGMRMGKGRKRLLIFDGLEIVGERNGI